MPIKPTDYLGSLAKGLAVLEAFGERHPRLSVSEAAVETGLDRAAARRCLLTLTELGYTSYDGKFFTPTPKVLRLGNGALSAFPLTQVVQPWLDQMSERLQQSVSVSVLDDLEIIYIARAAQRRVMTIGLMPGSRLPAHCTSMGRVLLAQLPEDQARDVVARSDLSPRTPNSRTTPDDVMAAIAAARSNGYALVDQEIELGLRSIAVPLISATGRVVAAVNVGVAAAQMPTADLSTRCLPELLKAQDGLRNMLR
ncbi:IclR family transcriptional regulator domain-containing protein [Pseudoprimorskyibacter insulae]|uniref:Pca regulon regulatory protein n=1 Tax=Pseudoprimorskyibacter insulae TaxID=1695997 RepID=A0A2R8AY22_9RHOB|nr:IclR family transcriptional regulator C-terminal domain-containing protein [Pseudoprimorskyibacter insulae]SPF80933.1 Pca regulon regulatory protein [Pseudoprimorskyibacter insulae]